MGYELVQNWLPEWKYSLKAPYPMSPQGIVVHNTAGASSAKDVISAMINNDAFTSFHVAIDEAFAVEAIPFSRNAWHAGDGGEGYANRNLIGIEICRDMDWSSNLYDLAEQNAVDYIAEVCLQFGWTSANLHQHNWYCSTSCPHRLKGHWEDFKRKVDEKIATISTGLPRNAASEENSVKVKLHGYERTIRGENKDGTVYVAIRDLVSQMGYEVSFADGIVNVEYKK